MVGRLVAALFCFAIGVAVGLGIGWDIWPVELINADPSDLRLSFADDYIRMIGSAYQLNGDLAQAKLRLSQLNLGTPSQTVIDFVRREDRTSTNTGKQEPRTREQVALIDLARTLAATPVAMAPTPSPTRTVVKVPTRNVSEGFALFAPPTPRSNLPTFRLVDRTLLTCAEEPDQAHIRIVVRDAQGGDMPNVGIEIRSPNGDDTVYTGLKPERGIGYADFRAAPDDYSISIVNAQLDPLVVPIGENPSNCRGDRGATPRGWRLVFQQ